MGVFHTAGSVIQAILIYYLMANIRLILDSCTDVFQIIVRKEKNHPITTILSQGFFRTIKEREILKMKVWYISKPLDKRQIYLSFHSSDFFESHNQAANIRQRRLLVYNPQRGQTNPRANQSHGMEPACILNVLQSKFN